MQLLLPNRFKKYGLFMAPLGFAVWIAMQLGVTKNIMLIYLAESSNIIVVANIIIAVISFFSFLVGMYFLVFSKEKIEDEMIQKTRLDSFQFAALVQIGCLIIGFLAMIIFNEPDKEGMAYFFILLVFIFWFSFIVRFNYIIHVGLKKLNAKYTEN